jgi:hypothetical protein
MRIKQGVFPRRSSFNSLEPAKDWAYHTYIHACM